MASSRSPKRLRRIATTASQNTPNTTDNMMSNVFGWLVSSPGRWTFETLRLLLPNKRTFHGPTSKSGMMNSQRSMITANAAVASAR